MGMNDHLPVIEPRTVERRFTSPSGRRVEARADGDARKIVGYGAVFYDGTPGSEYQPWPDFAERIMPTAFDRALRENDDVRGLFNHDPDNILGRTAANTMRLSVDSTGLAYEIDAPDTDLGRRVLVALERGDITGSSFAFIVERATWIEEEDRMIRQVDQVELFDVGPVTYPAYSATSSQARFALNAEIPHELAEFRRKRQAAAAQRDAEARERFLRISELSC